MYRTFNCGVGMVICVSAENKEQALKILNEQGETAWLIGHIENKEDGEAVVFTQ
jgi:phosphoribosylformylglycinamidine cyclo-ligase